MLKYAIPTRCHRNTTPPHNTHRYSPEIPKSKKWEATIDYLKDAEFARLLHLATKLDSLLVTHRAMVSRYETKKNFFFFLGGGVLL